MSSALTFQRVDAVVFDHIRAAVSLAVLPGEDEFQLRGKVIGIDETRGIDAARFATFDLQFVVSARTDKENIGILHPSSGLIGCRYAPDFLR